MPKAWDILRNRLSELSKARGFRAELARKMGVQQTLINRYLSGDLTPGIAQLDKFADALGVQPWELIKPDAALPTPAPQSPTVSSQAEIIVQQEARIQKLEALTKAFPVEVLEMGQYVPKEVWPQILQQFSVYKEYTLTGKVPAPAQKTHKKKA